ncbi:MAG TPA: shikimate dehydrogenase [Bradyrhizobium sp.]|uniref:shikimate dehydrogenase family protein n=1 Tax=Bradyrhizobium sp. TaxID=376 RepID=UPI002D7F5456|nr:shikimate dehydrogenase [Bradyrhizobium sp.]HET7885927.1 shikimate dehydrogenase [Bradyrhizobium sp.]
MIDGRTKLIAHIGYPTEPFKSPMIYNPWFEARKINAAVVPMGCKREDYPAFLKLVFRLSNVCGALITMPHKVTTLKLVDDASVAAKVAGACNAVKIDERGRMIGDMFDGEGFVRGVQRKGRRVAGASLFVAGCGGVGSAIAASMARAGGARLGLYDVSGPALGALVNRLQAHYPNLEIIAGSGDPAGYDIVVNATPLGMEKDDPLPIDVDRISPSALVGEVALQQEITPFLAAARAQGCEVQVGVDMLFEQIPAYLEFLGFGTTTPDELRRLAQIHY